MNRFKVGDRVRIKALPYYAPCRAQGLFVGNTGTVKRIYNHCVGVRTDNAESDADATGCDRGGWAFMPEDLAPIATPTIVSRIRNLFRKAA